MEDVATLNQRHPEAPYVQAAHVRASILRADEPVALTPSQERGKAAFLMGADSVTFTTSRRLDIHLTSARCEWERIPASQPPLP